MHPLSSVFLGNFTLFVVGCGLGVWTQFLMLLPGGQVKNNVHHLVVQIGTAVRKCEQEAAMGVCRAGDYFSKSPGTWDKAKKVAMISSTTERWNVGSEVKNPSSFPPWIYNYPALMRTFCKSASNKINATAIALCCVMQWGTWRKETIGFSCDHVLSGFLLWMLMTNAVAAYL